MSSLPSPPSSPSPGVARPPYLAAAVAALAVLAVYVWTLAPTTAFWDASEYIATAHILGIPHPPGNPLFVVLARAWILLLGPTGLPVAVRVNLLAAATSAGAAFFWFLVAHRLLAPSLRGAWAAAAGAGAATLLSATTYTVWNQSNVNEKVYTLSMLVIAAVSWLAVRWWDRREEPGSERLLLAAGYLVVLGSTNHLMSVLPLPALGLLVLTGRPAVLTRPRFLVRAVPLVVLGLSFNLVLPVRAAQDPVINEGDPTCETVTGALVAVYTNGSAGCPALADNLARRQYAKPPVTRRMAPFGHQMLNWWQYFDWQWARGLDPSELPGTRRTGISVIFLALGLAGLGVVLRRERQLGLYFGALAVVLTVGLVYYLNFKYGFSLAPEIADRTRHEVRERDYFFIAGFSFWGLLAGIGLGAGWGWMGRRLAAYVQAPEDAPEAGGAGQGRAAPRARGLMVISPVLMLATVPLAFNWGWASRAGDHAARDWAYDLLMSADPYAIVFTNGDNDTFPLWYLQEVEGLRRDVTVVVGQYLFTDWYPRQLAELTHPDRQRRFEPSQAQGLYDDRPPPDRPITTLAPEDMDRIEGGVLAETQTVNFPGLAVEVPAGTRFLRDGWLALRFIVDSMGERPVYFTNAQGLMSDIGLADFAVRQGLLYRLHVRPLQGAQPEGLVLGRPEYGGEWFDADLSLRLWNQIYRFRGLQDRDIWSDRATLNIPWYFYALALQLSDVARLRNRPAEEVEGLEAAAEDFAILSAGGRRGTPAALREGAEAGG